MRRTSSVRPSAGSVRTHRGRGLASLAVASVAVCGVAASTIVAAGPAGASTGSVSSGSAGASAARVAYTSIASSYDSEVLALTNAARRAHGVRPLSGMACVDGFASSWARYLAGNDAFRHQSLYPILRRCHRTGAGENIAWGSGYLSPSAVVRMWMNSPGHRRNILDGRFRYLGVDAYRSARTGRTYVVQDFAR